MARNRLEDLRSELEHAGVPFEALLTAYREAHPGSDDPDDFLVFLRHGEHLDEATYSDLVSIDIDVAVDAVELEELLPGWGDEDDIPMDVTAPLVLGSPPPAAMRRRYHMLGRLGEGAMGEVHLARERALRRKVAFKTIRAEARQDVDTLGRFLNEAQITAQLMHPNIVPVYGFEVAPDGSLGYAMEIVKGRSLEDLLEARWEALTQDPKGFDESRARIPHLEIFIKVCEALAFAHDKGVLHRDLKPENIMVGEHGQVYVMDWGLAKVMGAAEKLDLGEIVTASGERIQGKARATQLGIVLGTPVYLSPEQARSENQSLDPRSDIFTLGLILQHIVTLASPRVGDNVFEVIDMAQKGERRAVQHAMGSVSIPPELTAIIDKATRYERLERYASVQALSEEVHRFLRSAPGALELRPVAWEVAAVLGALTVGLVLGALLF